VSEGHLCGEEINIEDIRRRLREYASPAAEFTTGRILRAAAVLIPLVCSQEKWYLIFTRRTDLVRNHKGQVSFPGGAVEAEDTCREDTALRETYEEIGIERQNIEILGCLWDMPTITGFVITPVVGRVLWPIDMRLAAEEVSRAFIVPLDWLAESTNREEIEVILPDGREEKVIHFKPYDGEKIWGATARITMNFLKAIGLL
jgi:8-oxo-dGTP pyrophosphatase MutT (NUDIX family)